MLSWTNLNPTVKEVDTKKKFFGIYLYKAIVHAPGCRVISAAKDSESAHELLQTRIELLRNQKYFGGGYASSRATYLEIHAKADQLQYYIDLKKKYSDEIKIRLEEPSITIYSNDPELLYSIVSRNYPNRVTAIHRPKNTLAKDILDRGNIISIKAKDYSFKVCLSEKVFKDLSILHNVGDYLYNLGDEIEMTKSLRRKFGANFAFFGGGYFYCKDDKIVTFINLMCPNLVSGIYRLSEPEL